MGVADQHKTELRLPFRIGAWLLFLLGAIVLVRIGMEFAANRRWSLVPRALGCVPGMYIMGRIAITGRIKG